MLFGLGINNIQITCKTTWTASSPAFVQHQLRPGGGLGRGRSREGAWSVAALEGRGEAELEATWACHGQGCFPFPGLLEPPYTLGAETSALALIICTCLTVWPRSVHWRGPSS